MRRVVALDVGWLNDCAVLATGKVRCWGSNNDGQLGIGYPVTATPVAPAWPH